VQLTSDFLEPQRKRLIIVPHCEQILPSQPRVSRHETTANGSTFALLCLRTKPDSFRPQNCAVAIPSEKKWNCEPGPARRQVPNRKSKSTRKKSDGELVDARKTTGLIRRSHDQSTKYERVFASPPERENNVTATLFKRARHHRNERKSKALLRR